MGSLLYKSVIFKTVTYCLIISSLVILYINYLLPMGYPVSIDMTAVKVERYDEVGCVYSLKYPANVEYVNGWGVSETSSICNPALDDRSFDSEVSNIVTVTFRSFSSGELKKWVILSIN